MTRLLDPEALARLKGLQLVVRQAMEGVLTGIHGSRHRGASIEFQEHKEYSPGDEVRHIDWKAYARIDRFYVKQFEKETNLRAYLVLDKSATMGYGPDGTTKLFRATQIAATLASLLLRQQDAVGLLTFADTAETYIPPRASSAHLGVLLEELARIQPGGGTDLAAAVGHVAELAHPRSLVVIIGDLLGGDVERLGHSLRQLRGRRHEVTLLHVLHPWEMEFPFTDPTVFVDMEARDELLADPRGMRLAYLEELEAFKRRVRHACLETGTTYQLVDVARPVAEVLTELLATGRRG